MRVAVNGILYRGVSEYEKSIFLLISALLPFALIGRTENPEKSDRTRIQRRRNGLQYRNDAFNVGSVGTRRRLCLGTVIQR